MKKARVVVTIKKDVLDPAGAAVKNALSRQGLAQLGEVRIGKVIDISFGDDRDAHEYRSLVERAAQTILSNPVMEEFTIEMIDEKHDDH